MYISAWPSLNPVELVGRDASRAVPFPLASSTSSYFYVARNGIYHLMRSLLARKVRVILVPDYHHGNEVYAMKAAGMTLRYYPVKSNLDIDLDAITRLCNVEPRPQALYVTHFIGWPQPVHEIRALCRDKDLLFIEDCALSFLSTLQDKELGSFGSYAVFCLYKTLPLPNGGVVVANGQERLNGFTLRPCSTLSLGSTSVELMLRWIRMRFDTCGRALFAMKRIAGRTLDATNLEREPIGDTGFDVDASNTGMSGICHNMLKRFHYSQIKDTRRRNFKIVEARLRGKVALLDKPMPDGMCPLFFPLLTKDKQAASRALARRGIETIEFWNCGDPESSASGAASSYLRRHLLEVPIHQDMTPEAAAYTADEVLRLGVGLPA